MAATAEELKELALLAREQGDDDLEIKALEAYTALQTQQAAPAIAEPQGGVGQAIGDFGRGAGGLATELASGIDRGVLGLVDFFTMDQINNIRSIMGEDALPTLAQALISPKGSFTQGTFAEGLPTDIANAAGEFGVAAMTGQGLLKEGAKKLAPEALSTGARVLRQASSPSVMSAGGFGAVSGAGSEVGREVGGETGALVGSIAAPIAGVVAAKGLASGGKAIAEKLTAKFGKNIELINMETGLPTPALESALKRKGLTFGSIIDDVDNLPALTGDKTPDEIVHQIMVRKLKSGASDNALAIVKLGGKTGTEIVADEQGIEAVRQGFRQGDVAAAKTTNIATKREMEKMVAINRKILANTSEALNSHPADVAGKNMMEQFDFIRGKADRLRSDLERISTKSGLADPTKLEGPGTVRGLKGLEINRGPIEDALNEQLDKYLIKVSSRSATGKPTLDFMGSDISKDKTSQKIINDVIDLLDEPAGADAFRAHHLKRQLDTMLDFNKKSASGLTDAGKKFVGKIRTALNDSIRKVSPAYAKINDDLSMSIESLNEFQRVLGPSIDVFEDGASKAVGQDLRGLLSKRKSRVALENAVNSIDETSRKLGGSFDTRVKDLVQFANTLEDRFGAVARTSLKGELESVAGQVARGKGGMIDLAVSKAAKEAEKLRGINDENAFNAMQKILKTDSRN